MNLLREALELRTKPIAERREWCLRHTVTTSVGLSLLLSLPFAFLMGVFLGRPMTQVLLVTLVAFVVGVVVGVFALRATANADAD